MKTQASRLACLMSGGFLFTLLAAPLLAQDGTTEVAKAAEAAAAAHRAGDTAWMLTSSALVLLMTPGLALFYGGLVRSKNVLGTMMHSIFCMGLCTVVWVLYAYSIAFGEDTAGGLLGDMSRAFLKNTSADAPASDMGSSMLFMVFQMMFAIITPALISGAFAERIKFSAFSLFTLLWLTLVYAPIAHWVWGGGILSSAGWLGETLALGEGEATIKVGALDFAGGTVVHISSGVSALVFCLFLGKRRGYPDQPMTPHNLGMTVLGASLLWFGWFGFNAGSALASGSSAVLAFTGTHICAAAAAFAWAVIEWLHRGKASILGVATGLVAGLVCITPAASYVEPMPALFMGFIVAVVCYFFVAVIKVKLGYDDSLDAFGVHGVGGTIGALLTGVFCTAAASPAVAADSRGTQILAQVVAVAVTWVYAAVATAILFLILSKTIGVRVSPEEEETGLDVSQHGEVGYSL